MDQALARCVYAVDSMNSSAYEENTLDVVANDHTTPMTCATSQAASLFHLGEASYQLRCAMTNTANEVNR